MDLGPISALFLAASFISACPVAWYEARLKRHRRPGDRESAWKVVPRILQSPEHYTQEGRQYQGGARRHLVRMYLLLLCAPMARCVGT